MPHTDRHLVQRARAARQDPMLTRLCIGLLGLFPFVTMSVMTVVPSLSVSIVIAGVGAVTFMSILPRGNGRKS